MKKILAAILLVVLVGCAPAPEPSDTIPDQCLRTQLFQQCMSLLPKGPEVLTGGNDWNEVVAECESSAYYQSMRKREAIRPECQAR